MDAWVGATRSVIIRSHPQHFQRDCDNDSEPASSFRRALAYRLTLAHIPCEVGHCSACADQLDPEQETDQPYRGHGKVGPQYRREENPDQSACQHPAQLGKGRIVSEKTTFEMPSIMKKTIRSSVIVSIP
jgi:hypothetical protein